MACYFKFFLTTTTTVFVGVFVLLCFFLVIYYLVGACKGLRRASLVVINVLQLNSNSSSCL
ncbi:hypothetical protein CWB32_13775 [Bacillus cereus]|nr:hypothetical protein [Bacillus cereus]